MKQAEGSNTGRKGEHFPLVQASSAMLPHVLQHLFLAQKCTFEFLNLLSAILSEAGAQTLAAFYRTKVFECLGFFLYP